MRAPGNVGGFQAYPNLSSQLSNTISDIVGIANDASDQRFSSYRSYVQKALSVANGENPITDPCPTKLYGWRTLGHGSSGSGYADFAPLAGQMFETLSAGKLSEIQKKLNSQKRK